MYKRGISSHIRGLELIFCCFKALRIGHLFLFLDFFTSKAIFINHQKNSAGFRVFLPIYWELFGIFYQFSTLNSFFVKETGEEVSLSENQLVLKEGSEYSFPKFNTKIKFTAIMEKVLFTLLAFFFLSGEFKFTDVLTDLTSLLGHSIKTIRETLKSLAEMELINYTKAGKYRVVLLNLKNAFLQSVLVRFFGITDYSRIKCTELKRVLLGFYPIRDFEITIDTFRKETERIDQLIEKCQPIFDWVAEIETLEQLRKTTQSIHGPVEGNPILLFIDKVICDVVMQQSYQTADLTYDEIEVIVSKIISEFERPIPWSDEVDERYYPWANIEEELL